MHFKAFVILFVVAACEAQTCGTRAIHRTLGVCTRIQPVDNFRICQYSKQTTCGFGTQVADIVVIEPDQGICTRDAQCIYEV